MAVLNEYAEVLSPDFYEKCPKAVFAALAVSLANLQCDGDFEKVQFFLTEEWDALYKNGIVPQKPVRT